MTIWNGCSEKWRDSSGRAGVKEGDFYRIEPIAQINMVYCEYRK